MPSAALPFSMHDNPHPSRTAWEARGRRNRLEGHRSGSIFMQAWFTGGAAVKYYYSRQGSKRHTRFQHFITFAIHNQKTSFEQ
jgi:hypothetical protein